MVLEGPHDEAVGLRKIKNALLKLSRAFFVCNDPRIAGDLLFTGRFYVGIGSNGAINSTVNILKSFDAFSY